MSSPTRGAAYGRFFFCKRDKQLNYGGVYKELKKRCAGVGIAIGVVFIIMYCQFGLETAATTIVDVLWPIARLVL